MPDNKPRLCFVIMPFAEGLWEVYEKAIKPACTQAGFLPVRVDELEGQYNITLEIIEHIFRSEVVIADLTDWRPNVFYEMGVAHAIDNKTIMIIQKKNDVPFDVHSYKCIRYEQTEKGLEELARGLVSSLNSLERWRHRPTNPVQQFKPFDALVPKSELERVKQELLERANQAEKEKEALSKQNRALLKEKETLLKNTVPRPEHQALQKEIRKLQAQNLSAGKRLEELQQLLAEREKQNKLLQEHVNRLQAETEKQKTAPASPSRSQPTPLEILTRSKLPTPAIPLRSQPLEKLPGEQVAKMLKQYGFYCKEHEWSKPWANPAGKGIQHKYEAAESGKVIVDKTTGLMWQQSGSENYMVYSDAQEYIKELNRQEFAGYSDWRLPTLEEAMSLMEREKKNGLYIDPVFERKQEWIWTADKESASRAWVVYFYGGGCYHSVLLDNIYVRAVR